jgi:16S rRNA (cytidine1402-2'-O)-methyltransferase
MLNFSSKHMPGILYLVPNTLGSPSAASFDPLAGVIPSEVRSITSKIEYFIAENAKTTRAFLKLIASADPLAKPLQEIRIAELNVNTDPATLPALLSPVLEGRDAGLISEAGVPAVADPGANLLSIMASGLNGQSFAFNGYLPVDASQRAKRIKLLEERSRQEQQTQLFIETPYRNGALLEAMVAACQASTLISVATDLTLPSESIKTQTAAKWKSDLEANRTPDFHKKPTVFLLLAA